MNRTFFSVFFFMWGIFLQAQAAHVVADEAFLRTGPDRKSAVVERLQKGDTLKVVEEKEGWVLGESENNHVGWVPLSVIKMDGEVPPSTTLIPTPVATPAESLSTQKTDVVVESLKEATGPLPSPTPTPSVTPTPDSAPPVPSPEVQSTPTADQTTPASKISAPPALPTERPSTPSPSTNDAMLSSGDMKPEFHQIYLAIRPGFGIASTRPAAMDHHGFVVGGHVGYLLHRYVGLSLPYTYSRYSGDFELHTFGGGPLLRFVDLSFMRGQADANILYARALGANHWGWNIGGDLTFGFKNAKMQPFFGPFVRYEVIYLPGADIGAWQAGVSLTLTNFADLD